MGHAAWKQSNLMKTEEWPYKIQYAEKDGKALEVEEGQCSVWWTLKLTNKGQNTAKKEYKPGSD